MISKATRLLKRHIINFPGWRSKRKIVVIESDDWGSIRMPSKEVFQKLQEKGYQPEKDPFLKYDCLESEEDLSELFEVLAKFRDCKGNPAIITANAVVANPDFIRIKESGFSKYYYESIGETYLHYPDHTNVLRLWREGINNGFFKPQFHGREHLNVDCWMQGLRNKNSLLEQAFKHEMISISSLPSNMRFSYMEGLDYFNGKEKMQKAKIIEEGLKLFEQIVGYPSKSFIANCYIWNSEQEHTLAKNGVEFIQGIANQIQPHIEGTKHSHKYIRHYTGEQNMFGQYYLVRNAFFEPSLEHLHKNVVNECLSRINIAFRWGKPAIIGSHRLNFIGGIDRENRSQNLKLLAQLLKTILLQWPEVEFMTSDQVGALIKKSNLN